MISQYDIINNFSLTKAVIKQPYKLTFFLVRWMGFFAELQCEWVEWDDFKVALMYPYL